MTAGKLNKESIQRKFNSDSLFPTLSSELFFYWVCSKGWPKIRIIRINYPTFSTWSTLGTIDPSTCSYERKKIQIEVDTYGQGVVQAIRRLTRHNFASLLFLPWLWYLFMWGPAKKNSNQDCDYMGFFASPHFTIHIQATGTESHRDRWKISKYSSFLCEQWFMKQTIVVTHFLCCLMYFPSPLLLG